MLSLDYWGKYFTTIGNVLLTAIFIYIGVSIVLFINDAVKAKRENRKIKTGFKIMFLIAMILSAALLALGIYVIVVLLHLFINGPF